MTQKSATAQTSVRESLQEYGRGIAGGLIFSTPLLYTMEMWWFGFTIPPGRLLAGVAITMILLLGYNRFSGLRQDASWLEVVLDSVEEYGLGVLLSICTLLLLGRVTAEKSFDEIAGKVIIASLVVAIGVSVGTAQLGDAEGGDEGGMAEDQANDAEDEPATLSEQLVIALCGAVLFAANVAPTAEILVLGTQLSSGGLLALIAMTFVIGLLILHYSGFKRASTRVRGDTAFDVFGGAVLTYAVALVASAMLLWFFGRFDGMSPIAILGQVVVLGAPAMLGAAAGRLLLQ